MWDSKKPNALDAAKMELHNLLTNQSRIGATLLVKGEISGTEDLLIDGSVEGIVQLHRQELTIGPTSNVSADINAGEVIVRGNLKGNIRAKGRIEIGNVGSVTGNLTAPQVLIEDGALFKGSIEIEIEKRIEKETDKNTIFEIGPNPLKSLRSALG